MNRRTIYACLMAMGMMWVAGGTAATAQNISEKKQVTRPVAETSFRTIVRGMPDEWYRTREARTVADSVLAYQFPSGGWAKNQSWHQRPDANKEKERALIRQQMKSASGIGSTIDNMSTTLELLFLSKIYKATGRQVYRNPFMRGFEYLLDAHYDHRGRPP